MHIHHQLPSPVLPLSAPDTQRAIATRTAAVTRKKLAFYASIWQLDAAAEDGHQDQPSNRHQTQHDPDDQPSAGAFSVTV